MDSASSSKPPITPTMNISSMQSVQTVTLATLPQSTESYVVAIKDTVATNQFFDVDTNTGHDNTKLMKGIQDLSNGQHVQHEDAFSDNFFKDPIWKVIGHRISSTSKRFSPPTKPPKQRADGTMAHVTTEQDEVVAQLDAGLRAPSTTSAMEQGSNTLPHAPTVTHRVPSAEVHRAEHPGFVRKILMYHVMFLLCFSAAMAALIAALAGALGDMKQDNTIIAIITIGIITACVGIRNEVVLNILYLTVVHCLPRGLPRFIRVAAARFLYNVGGIHSGCGAAATVWLLYYIATIIDAGNIKVDVLATAILLFLHMATIVVLALPSVREHHHNVFEMSHRYLGWSAVLMLWLHVMAVYDVHMWRYPVFYLTIAVTVLVFLPWLFVRNVGVQCHVPYRNAVIMKCIPGAPLAGTFGRISTSPLGEWHCFATITTGDRTHIAHQKTHCMAIAAAGDWTKNLIANPPSRIWVRQIRTPGFMYTTRMFSRIVCMATGAGIAPVLPLVVQQTTDIFVVWVAREPEKFYGKQVFEWVTANRKCWIHDTGTSGHPNSVELALRAVSKHNAEALFIVSNPKLTYQVVRGCSEVGVPAFGAIWDS